METNTNKPWEKYGGAGAKTPAADTAPRPAGPSGGNKPWEKYGGARVVDIETLREDDMADAVSQAIEASAQNVAANMTGMEKVADWFGDVARGTFFGPIADPIAAQIISWREGDDVTYEQAYEAVTAYNKATKSTSANITGAILGGGLLAKGASKAVQATAKKGFAKGTVKYLQRDAKWNRFLGTTAATAGLGATEEGIRVGLEEAFDGLAGKGFDADRLGESVAMGAIIGGVAGNAIAAMQGAGQPVVDFFRRALGSDAANSQKAVRELMKEYRTGKETIEEASERFQHEVMRFQQANGRLPSAAEILKPEQVRNMSQVVREYNGLDIRARELGEAGVERALKEYDEVITKGNTLASPEAVRERVEDLFTDVMTRHGNKHVTISPEVGEQLMSNRKLIKAMSTSDNKGAAELGRILDHKHAIAGIRQKARAIANKSDAANRKVALNELRQELAEELDTMFREGGADASKVAELRNAIRLQDSIDNVLNSSASADLIGEEFDQIRRVLMRMDGELKNFEENGLTISLSAANDMRKMASDAFMMARRGDDAFAAATARQLRDAVSNVGKDEIPEYGKVVKTFNLENLRAEAMMTGRAAAQGEVILEDLASRIRTGRPVPNAPRASSGRQKAAVRRGVGEGMRLELNQAARKGTAEGVRAAVKLANSPQAQDSLALALPSMSAKEITRQAAKVAKTYENMGMLAGARSKSELALELEQAQDIATGAMFGNIGGAARVGLFRKVLRDLKMPRGTAEKIVDMLGDPDQIEPALRYMQSKRIRVAPLFAAITAHLSEPVGND